MATGWCAEAPAKAAPKPAASAGRPSSSDGDIEKAIRARFARSKISTNNFQVKVQGGIATIEGATNVIQHKGTATRLARSAGASGVVNNVKISEAARQKAAQYLRQGRRATVK